MLVYKYMTLLKVKNICLGYEKIRKYETFAVK